MDEKVKESLDFIRKYVDEYENIAVVSSWGKDSIVLLHLVLQVKPDIPVIFVDTTFKPDATYELRDRLIKEWNLNLIEVRSKIIDDKNLFSELILKPKLWETNPDLCCQYLKVEPARKIVQKLGLKAWFSGLRGTENEARSMFGEIFKQGEFMRLHPLYNWTEADVWRYMACYNLPAHPLYKEGYRSIGCEQCSSSGGKHERDGRWKGTSKQGCGCGLHDTCMVEGGDKE